MLVLFWISFQLSKIPVFLRPCVQLISPATAKGVIETPFTYIVYIYIYTVRTCSSLNSQPYTSPAQMNLSGLDIIPSKLKTILLFLKLASLHFTPRKGLNKRCGRMQIREDSRPASGLISCNLTPSQSYLTWITFRPQKKTSFN